MHASRGFAVANLIFETKCDIPAGGVEAAKLNVTNCVSSLGSIGHVGNVVEILSIAPISVYHESMVQRIQHMNTVHAAEQNSSDVLD